VNGAGERAGGLAAAVGRHVFPENTVQHVARDVECELVLESRDAGEIALVACLCKRFEGLVRSIYIRLVVLVVMQLHDLRRDMRLESTVVVWKIRKRVLGHDISLLLEHLKHSSCPHGTPLRELRLRRPYRTGPKARPQAPLKKEG